MMIIRLWEAKTGQKLAENRPFSHLSHITSEFLDVVHIVHAHYGFMQNPSPLGP